MCCVPVALPGVLFMYCFCRSVHTSVPSYASSSTSLRVHECCPVLFSVPLLLYECYLYTSVIARLIAMVP